MASSGSIGSGAFNKVERTGKQAANTKAVEWLARLGVATRGIVYGLVGWLALLAAFHVGGTTTDRKGAIMAIYQQPFGVFLLIVVAIGLVGYALWNILRSLLDTDHKGTDKKALVSRIAYFGIAISYGALAFAVLNLLLGRGSGKSSDQSTQDWTATLLKQPFGVFLVVLVGLIVLGVGISQFYQAYKASFTRHTNTTAMSATMRTWFKRFGQFGLAARGIVFVIISIFLIIAAFQRNAGEAKGLGGALNELSTQPYGQFLLAIVGLGFIAYGLYSLIEARYRQVGKA